MDFKSVFIENPYEDDEKYPKEQYPYQFKVNKLLKNKFDKWAPVFMSMLVDIAKKTRGNVNDCQMVMASSDQYREGQDYLAEFVRDKIEKKKGERIRKTEVREDFRQWYVANYNRMVPDKRELEDYLTKRFGRPVAKGKKAGWQNVCIIRDNDTDEEEDHMISGM